MHPGVCTYQLHFVLYLSAHSPPFQEAEQERVVSYWKANTQIYKQKVGGDLLARIRERKEVKQEISDSARNAHEDSFAVKLATIEERYCRACMATPNHPPFDY